MLSSALLSVLLASAPAAKAQSFPWLPRAVFVGSYFNEGAVTPQLRAQWQLTLIQESVDALVLFAEVGGGYAVSLPRFRFPSGLEDRLTFYYQHVAVFGAGYRGSHASGFQWGAHAGVGPTFYGARFEKAPREAGITGIVEGRVQAGWRFGAVTIGAALGYGSAFNVPRASFSAGYNGGLQVGLYADWR